MSQAKTLFEKIWDAHVILTNEEGQSLLFVDRHYCHDGSFHAFDMLSESGRKVLRPDLTFGTPDHYIGTKAEDRLDYADDERRTVVEAIGKNAAEFGINLFGIDDPRQGIAHVVGPEQGLSLPGLLIVCGDSHTSSHGAMGAFAFGIGASEVAHVLATQSLWQLKPKSMQITITGERGVGVTAKDVILGVIAKISAAGAVGYAIEYAGPVIEAMTVEERLTVCNMSIEAGARAGMVAPDQTTIDYIKHRPFAPTGDAWDAAVAYWRTLPSDPGAAFDTEVEFDVGSLSPTLTWGTSPEDAIGITDLVPDPAQETDPQRQHAKQRSLDYMGLSAGQPLTGLPIDRVFIGSCTNGRIEDLRSAAAVARGRTAKVPTMVVPGSGIVKAQAEAEGLDKIFTDAGFEWRYAGCSMCVGINGDDVAAKVRCVSTANRNFEGRQGPGARTHLAGPEMAAAAAVTGCLTDVRDLMDGK
jgi:3-isopropylmalate/(R)-2-methylmalate dehydratase large subunit